MNVWPTNLQSVLQPKVKKETLSKAALASLEPEMFHPTRSISFDTLPDFRFLHLKDVRQSGRERELGISQEGENKNICSLYFPLCHNV